MANTKLGNITAATIIGLCAAFPTPNDNTICESVISPVENPMCPKKKSVEIPNKYAHIVRDLAEKYEIDQNLIAAVIKQESHWKPDAKNARTQCKGLMQLKDETAADMAKKIGMKNYNVFDAATNIELGTAYLKWLKSRDSINTVEDVLTAYNWGYGNFLKRSKALPKETRNYVKNITESMGL